MNWFKEHQKMSLFLALLLVLVLVIVFSYTTGDSTSPIGRVIQSGLSFVEEPMTLAADGLSNGIKGIFQFRTIMKENDALKEEISDLKRELILSKLSEIDLAELRTLSEQLNYQGKANAYHIVTADVIAMNGANWFNVYTINVGTDDGVSKDATVINGDGLIGKVIEASGSWSKVISTVDESSQVSFRVLRDFNLIGICEGDGNGGLSGYMLDAEDAVIEGDTLITTGIGLYPEGFEIGKVKEVLWDKDLLVKRVTIEPSVSYKNVRKVAVIIQD